MELAKWNNSFGPRRRVGPDADVAESDGAVIALQEQRAGRRFGVAPGMAGWPFQFHIFMNDLAAQAFRLQMESG